MKWNRKKGLVLTALLMTFCLAAGIPSEAAEGYRIGIGKDQTVKVDQTVTLDVTATVPGGVFNTADMTFSYEKEYLTFDKIIACGGSWMVKDTLIKDGNFEKIRELTAQAAALVK